MHSHFATNELQATSAGTGINELENSFSSGEALLGAALAAAQNKISQFAQVQGALQRLDEVFEVTDYRAAETLLDEWANGLFAEIPTVVVLDQAILQNARGAYSAANNTIYVADTLLRPDALTGLTDVLIEELGHYFDTQLNPGADTAGDEGELFALVVSGADITAADLFRIQTEDDTAEIIIDGQAIAVEQSGMNSIWYMGGVNSNQILGTSLLSSVSGDWDIKGVGDFNRDGHPDLVWRDNSSGMNSIWYMGGVNSNQILGTSLLSSVSGDWDIKGVGDFNRDGRPDLVWRDNSSGMNSIWYMGGVNGNQILGTSLLSSVSGDWDIKGVGDFNRDGHPDLVWRDHKTASSSSKKPDLTIQGNTSLGANQTVLLDALVSNGGEGSAGASVVKYWRSDDAVLDASDTELTPVTSVNAISAGNSQSISAGFDYSTWNAGQQYIIAKADADEAVTEADESNNVSAFTVTIPSLGPDLTITSKSVPPNVTAGNTMNLDVTIKNIGGDTAGASKLKYYISEDGTLDINSDQLLGEEDIIQLASNATQTLQFQVNTSDFSAGEKYIFFVADADGEVTEGNESNNQASSMINVALSEGGLPDLLVNTARAVDSNRNEVTTIIQGQQISLVAEIGNKGSANDTTGSTVDFWLSNDNIFAPDTDTKLYTGSVEPLDANGLEDLKQSDPLDTSSWSTGTKYLFFRADSEGVIAEENENNNLFSLQINVIAGF